MENSDNHAAAAERRSRESATPTTRPTTARAARLEARSSPTAVSPGFWEKTGRERWKNWKHSSDVRKQLTLFLLPYSKLISILHGFDSIEIDLQQFFALHLRPSFVA